MSFRQRFRKSFTQAKEDLASLFKDKDESHTRPNTPIDKTRHSRSLVDVTDSSNPGLHKISHTKIPTDYLHPHYTPSHAKSFERMPLRTTPTQKDHLGTTSNHVRASSSPANPHISELGSKRVGPDVVNVAELASRLSKTPRAQVPRDQTPRAQTPTKQFFHPRLRNVGTNKPSEGSAQVANQNYRKEEHLATVDNPDRALRSNISAPVDKGLKPSVRTITPTRKDYVAPADNRVRPLNVRASADPGPAAGFRFPKTPSPRPDINPNRYLQPCPNNTFDTDKSVKGSTRIAEPVQNDRVDAVDVGGQALGSNIAAPVDFGARTPKPGMREIGSDVVPSRVEQDGCTPRLQTTEQPPPVIADTPSIKWKGVKEFARVLEPLTNLFGPIKEMANLLVECVEKYELAEESKAEYEALRIRLDGIFETLSGQFGEECSLVMTSSIESLCRSIKGELKYIKDLQERNVVVRYLLATDESKRVLACYRRIEGHLQRLSLNANLSMWKIVQEHAADFRSDRMSSRIEHLPSSLSAWYDSAEGIELRRRECTPGTRVNVLANLLDWARSGGGGVYWLNGMAGTGKTTIAYSVCADLDARQQLGGSFFCSRLREECRNVNLIIPSIAYQLARFSRPFQSALSKVLEKDPNVYGRQPHMQFDALIARPILEVQHTLPEELIVVIDALDECDQKESTERMLDVLLSKSTNLPIMFIVSSRPEPQIRDQMTRERVKSRLVLHELDKGEVQADIDRYLREGLAQMNPSEAEITSLVERAGILFIYAATAVRYISYDNFHRNPGARLRTILNRPDQITTQSTEIDDLYTTILKAAFGDERLEETDRVDMQQVLDWTVGTPAN
ncbi:unnamed protein product [Rhizoctonia solani]|uniref:NACHT domain-containing protein n=1 Tax=Rhizoctonia solani TaxID=456999 RepID=A0A8H3D0M8_9AGAM|nr:unnamed protein product [Rhizoctonia solani]